ncbi:MAG: hypothetical protein ACOCWQ_02600 [Nanoarchaeota archaeon]
MPEKEEKIKRRLKEFKKCNECKSLLKNFHERKATDHLRKSHDLVPENYYAGIHMMFGMIIGLSIGTALGNIPIGLIFGLAAGAFMDKKAREGKKVI